jgi:hypothetical protein
MSICRSNWAIFHLRAAIKLPNILLKSNLTQKLVKAFYYNTSYFDLEVETSTVAEASFQDGSRLHLPEPVIIWFRRETQQGKLKTF